MIKAVSRCVPTTPPNQRRVLTCRASASQTMAAAGIVRSIKWDDLGNVAGDVSGDVLGWGLNLSSNVKLGEASTARLQFVYGEGCQMLSQTAGTLGRMVDLDHYTDRGHYRLPEPEGYRTAYGLVTLSPPGGGADRPTDPRGGAFRP